MDTPVLVLVYLDRQLFFLDHRPHFIVTQYCYCIGRDRAQRDHNTIIYNKLSKKKVYFSPMAETDFPKPPHERRTSKVPSKHINVI